MALAIDIEDLLNKQKIESSRIEFKKGWNPAKKSRGQVKNHGDRYCFLINE